MQGPAIGNDAVTVSYTGFPFKCPVRLNLLLPCRPQSTSPTLSHLSANMLRSTRVCSSTRAQLQLPPALLLTGWPVQGHCNTTLRPQICA